MSKNLPKGFWRSKNGSIRVLIRVKGWPTAIRTFKLFADTPEERRRQLAEAQLWAAETRRKMYAGAHSISREAEKLTLGAALRRYARDGLSSKLINRRKDELRIQELLRDEIAQRSVASLNRTDLAAYRDILIARAYQRKLDRAVSRLKKSSDPTAAKRIRALTVKLPQLQAYIRKHPDDRDRVAEKIAAIERDEGIGPVARSTIGNKIQLIRRALKFVGQTVPGVPEITGIALPRATPGRCQRPSDDELRRILARGGEYHPFLPNIVKFAVATALRIQRVLEFRTSHIHDLGGGRYAIVFPRSAERAKRTGIIPVTDEIADIILDAVQAQGGPSALELLPAADIRLFPVSQNVLSHAWRDLLAQLNIADLHLHDLRHEATSRYFERGLSAAEVMSITGHSTNDMVDRYAHYSAVLVLERLEKSAAQNDPGDILREMAVLARRYRAADGDEQELVRCLQLQN